MPAEQPQPIAGETWVGWDPPISEHVSGWYTERHYDENGIGEEQHVLAVCRKCGVRFQRRCSSGQVRTHIQRFGAVHRHIDPLEAPRVVRPGSLRNGGSRKA